MSIPDSIKCIEESEKRIERLEEIYKPWGNDTGGIEKFNIHLKVNYHLLNPWVHGSEPEGVVDYDGFKRHEVARFIEMVIKMEKENINNEKLRIKTGLGINNEDILNLIKQPKGKPK